MSARTEISHALGARERWTAVIVECDVVRTDGRCASQFSGTVRSDETEAAAKRRVIAEACAGRWVKVGRVLHCPRCAATSGRVA